MPRATRNSEKRKVSLIVNPQFSEFWRTGDVPSCEPKIIRIRRFEKSEK